MARVKLHLDQVAHLPPVCVCCGQPATRVRRQEFRLDRALSAAVLVTAAMLDALAWTERSVSLSLPVCEYHGRRGRRSNRTFFRGMALTAALGVAAYVVSQLGHAAASYLGVAALFAFIVTVVVAMHEVDDGLGIRSLGGGSFTLGGVSPKFAQAVQGREQGRPTVGLPGSRTPV
jgi:hypothetical protein